MKKENDGEVIHRIAERQANLVRQSQRTIHSGLAKQILDEIEGRLT